MAISDLEWEAGDIGMLTPPVQMSQKFARYYSQPTGKQEGEAERKMLKRERERGRMRQEKNRMWWKWEEEVITRRYFIEITKNWKKHRREFWRSNGRRTRK